MDVTVIIWEKSFSQEQFVIVFCCLFASYQAHRRQQEYLSVGSLRAARIQYVVVVVVVALYCH